MSKQVQWRRGTATQNNAFTGAAGEVTVDTNGNSLRVHDGTTAGGFETARKTALDNHVAETDNPHSVTKSQVGLGNVDNTSDLSKPVSTATQTALNSKAPTASPTFTGTVSGVTKAHVGLGNVDNTSDLSKPISTATQTALNSKAPTSSPTFTGTVSGVTKAHVGLGNVDNVSAANLRDRSTHTGTQTLDTITETAAKKILTDDERSKIVRSDERVAVFGDTPVTVDRSLGTITFPLLRLERLLEASVVTTAITSLPISTTNARRYYFADRSTGVVSSTTDGNIAYSDDNQFYLGMTAFGFFQSPQGVRVDYQSEKDAFDAVSKTGLAGVVPLNFADNFLELDTVEKTVRWPILRIVRPGLPGIATAAAAVLPLEMLNVSIYYYIDLSAETPAVQSTTTAANALSTLNRIYLGSSSFGAVANTYGLEVRRKVRDRAADVNMHQVVRRGAQAQVDKVPMMRNVFEGRAAERIDTSPPFVAAYPDDRTIRINSAGGEIDASYFVAGTSALIVATQAGTVFLGAKSILGADPSFNEISMPINSAIRLTFVDPFYVVEAVSGTVTPRARMSSAVRATSRLVMGQSLAVRHVLQGGVGGYSDGMADGSWVQTANTGSVYHIGAATGGSSIGDRNTNWWFRRSDSVKGPAYIAALAALDAALSGGQPVPSRIYWSQGEAEWSYLGNATLTVAELVLELRALFADIQSELSSRGAASNVPIIIALPGSQDIDADAVGGSGVTVAQLHAGATACRAAYLQAISEVAYLHQGMDHYDIPRARWGEIHLDERGFYDHGRRQALAEANLYLGQTNDLGPRLELADISGSTTARLTLAGAGLVIPAKPSMFGIVPAGGAPGITPYVDVVETTVSADGKILLRTRESLTGCRVVYPTGAGKDPFNGITFRNDQIVRDTRGLPLRSFVSAALS